MPPLNLALNLSGHDDLYEALVRMHDGLTEGDSLRLWVRLALILMNHVDGHDVIQAAIRTARDG